MPNESAGSNGDEDVADLSHVSRWVFDLDNTLYPAEANLFAQIDARMRAFIGRRLNMAPEEAKRLQKGYYVAYGTTLAGLMAEHRIDAEEFLHYVHDIDLDVLRADDALKAAIAALPGRRYIFTNSSIDHAERVCARLGLTGLFDDIFDIRAAAFTPKPRRETYERFLGARAVDAGSAAMFEDIAQNLEAAHALGMTTVLVSSDAPWIEDEPAEKRPAARDARHDHVHHVTENLAAFLASAKRGSHDD